FIVTLAGMFLARGLCFTISEKQISIDDGFFDAVALNRITLPGDVRVSVGALVALAVFAVAVYVLHWTRTGRNVYAIGGGEQSALLMGLPVARTKIQVYAISGFCSALGGVLFAFYTLSGDGLHAVGMELDAIAAVVIGGTVLTGGSGYVFGTLLGGLVLRVIKTILTFEGTLSSWSTRIAISVLLFAFIALQRLVGVPRTARSPQAPSTSRRHSGAHFTKIGREVRGSNRKPAPPLIFVTATSPLSGAAVPVATTRAVQSVAVPLISTSRNGFTARTIAWSAPGA